MKKTPDIILDAEVPKQTSHKPRGYDLGVKPHGSNDWSQNYGGYVSFTIGQFVMAKYSDGSFRAGKVLAIEWSGGHKIYKVKLSNAHHGEVIESISLKAISAAPQEQ